MMKQVNILFQVHVFAPIPIAQPSPLLPMPHSPKPFSLKFVVTPAIVTPVEEIICASRRVITEEECEIAVTKLCLWPHDQPETSMLLHTHYSSPLLSSFLYIFLPSFPVSLCSTRFPFLLPFPLQWSQSLVLFLSTLKKNPKNTQLSYVFLFIHTVSQLYQHQYIK